MSEEDDDHAWAMGWMVDHPQLEECAAARVTIDGITHRTLNEGSYPGWQTLCKSHVLAIRIGRFVDMDGTGRPYGFSLASVDCLCCIPAGG